MDVIDKLALDADKNNKKKKIHTALSKTFKDEINAMSNIIANIANTDEGSRVMMEEFSALSDIFETIGDIEFCRKNAYYFANTFKCKKKIDSFFIFLNSNEDTDGISIDYDEFKMICNYKSNKLSNNTSIIADGFYFKINYRLEDEDENVRWVLQVFQKDSEEVMTLEVTNDDFSNVKNMKKLFLAKRLTLMITEAQLSQLHQFLLKFNPKDAKKLTRLGYDDTTGAYVFANGAVYNNFFYKPNENGIVDVNNSTLAMPFFSEKKVKDSWFQYVNENEAFDFKKFCHYFFQAHGRKIGIPAVGHYIFSVFRDVIIDKLGVSPHLFLKGPAGSGKSSIARNILTLFGTPPREGNINLKAKVTEPAMNRIFTQYSNFPLWVDEYVTDHPIEGLIQAAYDNSGIIKAKGTNGNYNTGNQVDTTALTCSLMITTNYFPSASQEPLFSRLVYIAATNNNREVYQRSAYEILRNYETTGLSHITSYICSLRGEFEKIFISNYFSILDRLKKLITDRSVNDRLLINQSILLASYHTINTAIHFDLPESNGVQMTHQQMLDRAINDATLQIQIQHEQMSNNSPLRLFFEILQLMYNNRQLLFNKNYKFIVDKMGVEKLVIRFDNIWGFFKILYQNNYRALPPDQNTILDEFAKFLKLPSSDLVFKPHTFEKSKSDESNEDRFSTTQKAFSCKKCIEIPYEEVQDRYGIDFNMKN